MQHILDGNSSSLLFSSDLQQCVHVHVTINILTVESMTLTGLFLDSIIDNSNIETIFPMHIKMIVTHYSTNQVVL